MRDVEAGASLEGRLVKGSIDAACVGVFQYINYSYLVPIS